jgi:hypothetical protein
MRFYATIGFMYEQSDPPVGIPLTACGQMYILDMHKKEIRMKASIVDLRYKMNEVLKALDRREKVTILYRGRVKATILPTSEKKSMKVEEHPFFGMNVNEERSVQEQMGSLRRPRQDAV